MEIKNFLDLQTAIDTFRYCEEKANELVRRINNGEQLQAVLYVKNLKRDYFLVNWVGGDGEEKPIFVINYYFGEKQDLRNAHVYEPVNYVSQLKHQLFELWCEFDGKEIVIEKE